MPESIRFNYNGFNGFIVALLSISAYFVLKNKQCFDYDGGYHNIAIIQIVGTVCGSVIFLFSLLNTTATLYNTKSLVFSVVVVIIIVGVLMFWSVYIAFTQPCIDGLQHIERQLSVNRKNAFSAQDVHNIVIMVIDHIIGLMLLSIGITIARRRLFETRV